MADGPVISSVKDAKGLALALASDVAVLFLLYGDILSIGALTAQIHACGKAAFVHLDLIEGLSALSAGAVAVSATNPEVWAM